MHGASEPNVPLWQHSEIFSIEMVSRKYIDFCVSAIYYRQMSRQTLDVGLSVIWIDVATWLELWIVSSSNVFWVVARSIVRVHVPLFQISHKLGFGFDSLSVLSTFIDHIVVERPEDYGAYLNYVQKFTDILVSTIN